MSLFFFFQAEDGIRDYKVTGVQTCALPIFHGGVLRSEMSRDAAELTKQITAILDTTAAPVVTFDNLTGTLRSEERRVGKECGALGARWHDDETWERGGDGCNISRTRRSRDE